MMTNQYPLKASILIPVLNEEGFIENCIDSIISRTEDISNMEIIIIDGGSQDSTVNIVEELIKEYSFIKLLHNKKKITPAALNIGIKNSQGNYIVRLDAHAEYSDGYISNSISALENSSKDVVNVGGPIETKTDSTNQFSKAISICLSSIFGVGNSKFRTEIPKKPIFVETVPFGCFRRELFEEIGLFNEDEPRNEDLEFNKRILNSGKKILLDPRIKSTYFSRSDLNSLVSQQFDNGKIVTNKYRGKDSFHKLRHFIPFLFTTYIASLFPFQLLVVNYLDTSLPLMAIYSLPLIMYFCANIFFSTSIVIKGKDGKLFLPLFFGFLLIHLSYGFGSLFGFLNLRKKESFKEFMNKVFPYETTFERRHFGFFTNLIKFFSLRFAYLLFRFNISANFLTIFSAFLTLPCFYLLYEGTQNTNIIFIISGYSLIGIVLFIDFVDGSLARINKFSYAAGDTLDNLPPDIIRIGSILFFGVITGSKLFILLAFMSSIIISYYLPATLDNIQEKRKWILTIFASRMAITGLRVISLLLMPIVTFSIYFFGSVGINISSLIVIIYFLFSFMWIILTLEDKELRKL